MGLLTGRPSSTPFQVDNPFFLDIQDNPDWQHQFGNNHPIKLEIGFGMGDFLVAISQREPNCNFVGIDFSQVGIQKLLEKIQTLQLKNIRIIFGDIREKLPTLFKNEQLNSIYINLPDPWPKKRHIKRRLIQPELVKQITQKLAPRGKLYLATDSQTYANEILEYFNAESLLQNINGIFYERGYLPKSKYEKSFIYAGEKINYLEYYKLVGNKKKSKKRETLTVEELTNKDEYLTKIENRSFFPQDACDLKQIADQLAKAGKAERARSFYKKAEKNVEDCLDLNWLAYSIASELDDKNWAIKIYKVAEDTAENSLDLNWLAYSIFESLGDKDWAKNLFQKAEIQNENIREMCDRAESISEILNDEKWQLNVYKKATANAKEFSEFYELADNIFAKLGDKKWASELYYKAEEKAEDCCDFISLAECFLEKLGNGKEAGRVYKKAETQAEDSLDLYCLAESITTTLGDREWADKVAKKAQL